MLRLLSYVIIGIVSSAVTAFVFSGGKIVGPSQIQNPPSLEFSYSDFVSFLLTVLAMILTALALVIGLVAFRTITEIKQSAGRAAQERVSEAYEELPDKIEEEVEKAVISGKFDERIERAILRKGLGGGSMNSELQPSFED